MSLKKSALPWVLILALLLTSLACQLVDRLSNRFAGGTPGSSPSVTMSVPPLITGSEYPEPGSYPQPGTAIATPSPRAGSETATPIGIIPTSTPLAENPTSTDSSYPGPLPGLPTVTDLSYPGPGILQSSTPVAATVSGTPSETPFTVTPSPSFSPGATDTIGGNPYPGPVTSSPTPSVAAGTATSTPILAITQTPLPPIFQPTFTPSASPTSPPTSTPTPTPILLPPWLSSGLRATDPATVRLASGKLQFVMFFAFWDGPSQAMAPLIHGLEARYFTQMNFIYLDVDDPRTSPLKQTLGYRIQPHFFLLNEQGVVLKQWVGYIQIESLLSAIEEALP